jgi:hypothetical protein
MVIDNLDFVGVAGPPNEAHPILSVDPDELAHVVTLAEKAQLAKEPHCLHLLITSVAAYPATVPATTRALHPRI